MVRKTERSQPAQPSQEACKPRRSREETQALRAARTQQRQQAKAAAKAATGAEAPRPVAMPVQALAVSGDSLETARSADFDAHAYGAFAALPPLALEKIARHAGPGAVRGLMQSSRSLHQALSHLTQEFLPTMLAAVLQDPQRLSGALANPAFRRHLAQLEILHTPEGISNFELQRVLNVCPKLNRLTIESVEPQRPNMPKLRLPKTLRHLSLPAEGEYLFHQIVGNRQLESLEWRGDVQHGEETELWTERAKFAQLAASQTQHVRLPHAISAFRAAVREGQHDTVLFYLDRHLNIDAFADQHEAVLLDAEQAGGPLLVQLLRERGLGAGKGATPAPPA